MSLSEKIFNYRLRKQLRSTKAFPVWNKIKKVVVVFESDEEERNTQVMQLLKELRDEHKQVVAWGYTDKKWALTPSGIGLKMVSKGDLGWFGRPKKEVIAELQSEHYDLLIDLSLTSPLPTRYLSLYTNAAFKTGRHINTEPFIYDFMIQLPEDKEASFLFDQIMYYLKNIQSND